MNFDFGTPRPGRLALAALFALTGAVPAAAQGVQPPAGASVFATKADLTRALAQPGAPPMTHAYVLAVAGQGANSGCGLLFTREREASGVFGEIETGGAWWRPRYSHSPVRACEFGAVGDARVPVGGGAFVAQANGTTRLAVSNTAGLAVGMRVASVNWRSLGADAIPSPTTITAIEQGAVIVSQPIAAHANLALVAYDPINAETAPGADSTKAIQAALDYALRNRLADVQLAEGVYKISDTLHLGYGDTFRTISLIGARRSGISPALAGVSLVSVAPDRPAISIQGGRSVGIYGVGLFGPNYNHARYAQWFNNALSADPLDWLAPDLHRSGASPGGLQPHSPLAGVVVDAYSGAAPADAYPAVAYPAWTGLTSQFNKPFTSDVTLDDVSIQGFAVQFAAGLTTDAQGDYIRIRNSTIGVGPYGLSISNSQSRNVEARNLSCAGMHTVLTGTVFGEKKGQWNGPIDNLSCGGLYQIGDFTGLGYTGPLVFRHLYCENCVRIGRFKGTSAYASPVTFEGGSLHMDNGLHGRIPASLIEAGVNQDFFFRGVHIVGSTRLTTLIAGGDPGLFIDSGMWVAALDMGGLNGAAWKQAAVNYSGGILFGSPRFNPANIDKTRVTGALTATALPLPIMPGRSSHPLSDDIQFSGAVGVLKRAPITQASKGFVDTNNRRWTLQLPSFGVLALDNRRSGVGAPRWAQDVMTFTLPGAMFANPAFALAPGWLLYHSDSGAIFIVSAVGAPDADGAREIVTQQQNALQLDARGAFVANLLPGPRLTGATLVIPTDVKAPRQVMFGDFERGSTRVANVSAGDGKANDLANWLAVGDRLAGPRFNDASSPWPIEAGGSALAAVTPGSPGALEMTKPAAATGRFPVYPAPIR